MLWGLGSIKDPRLEAGVDQVGTSCAKGPMGQPWGLASLGLAQGEGNRHRDMNSLRGEQAPRARGGEWRQYRFAACQSCGIR